MIIRLSAALALINHWTNDPRYILYYSYATGTSLGSDPIQSACVQLVAMRDGCDDSVEMRSGAG